MISVAQLRSPVPAQAFGRAHELEQQMRKGVLLMGSLLAVSLYVVQLAALTVFSGFVLTGASDVLFIAQLAVPLLAYGATQEWTNSELSPETDGSRLARIATAAARLPWVCGVLSAIRGRGYPVTRAEARWLVESTFDDTELVLAQTVRNDPLPSTPPQAVQRRPGSR